MEKRGCFVFRPRSVLSVYSETSASPSSAPCLPFRHSCSSFFPFSFFSTPFYLSASTSLSLSLSLFRFLLFPRMGRATYFTRAFFYKIDRIVEIEDTDSRGAGVSKVLGYRTIGGGEAELLEGQTLLGPRLSFPSSPVSKRSRRWYRVYTEIFIEERFAEFRDGLGLKKRKKFWREQVVIICLNISLRERGLIIFIYLFYLSRFFLRLWRLNGKIGFVYSTQIVLANRF